MKEQPKPLEMMDLGLCEYRPVLEAQERLVARRKEDDIPDTLLLVEHKPVYTLGRNADKSHITADHSELRCMGISVEDTGRGGDVTYHGPGQLVGYPIIKLSGHGRGAVWYVDKIEEFIIAVLSEFGISGTTDPENRGVWIGSNKIAAIGVRITRQITMHGFALNVNPDLNHYTGIVACGIVNRGVTSMKEALPENVSEQITMETVKKTAVKKFRSVFGYSKKGIIRRVKSPDLV